MKLTQPFLLILILVSNFSFVLAQKGSLYLQNYNIPQVPTSPTTYSIDLGSRQYMYLGGSLGVLVFNGISWDMVETPGSVFAQLPDPDDSNKMYVAGQNFFGYLRTLPNGQTQFISLSKDATQDFRIQKIVADQNHVFFKSNTQIFICSRTDDSFQQILSSPAKESFSGIFQLKGQIFVSLKSKGIAQLLFSGNSFALKDLQIPNSRDIQVAIPLDDQYALLSNSADSLYWFNGKSLVPFRLESKEYIRRFHLECGLRLPNGKIALGTRLAGVLIIDPKTRKTNEVINFQTGLPDDEVLALGLDPQMGLWISHGQGISRVDLHLPIRSFSTYQGLEGQVNTAHQHHNVLLAGTTQGLFYLKKVENYLEAQQYLLGNPTKTKEPALKVKIYEARKETTVGNLINKAFGKEKGGKVEVIKNPEQPAESPEKSFPDEESKRIYTLQSVSYVFSPIPGIKAKINRILPAAQGVLVASNGGLFYVEQLQAKTLLPDLRINAIEPDPRNPDQFWVATEQGLYKLNKKGMEWSNSSVLETQESLNSLIFYKNMLWAGGFKQIYRINPAKLGSKAKIYTFKNPYGQASHLFLKENKLYLGTWSAQYSYVSLVDAFVLEKKDSSNALIIHHQQDYQWQKTAQGWKGTGFEPSQNFIYSFLNFIPDIQDIYVASKQSLWISSKSQLYHFNTQGYKSYPFDAEVAIHTLSDRNKNFYRLIRPKISYDAKALDLEFELAHPFYLGDGQTRFQYYLRKFDKKWSDLKPSKTFHFSHLPAGSYTLHVKALNALGQMSREKSFKFYVSPPFWETWWFYSIQTLILGGLVFLSYYYNRTQEDHRWGQILAVVTIITFFEFFVFMVEPYVEQFSGGVPIFKLLMNILLAVSLNPAEHYLKKWLAQKPTKTVTADRAA